MNSIPFTQADTKVKALYSKLQNAFHSNTLPLFFTYLGPFPEYLEYITDQIVLNVLSPKFASITKMLVEEVEDIISLQPSKKTQEWLEKFRHTPAFYHFQKDNQENFSINIQLAIIFIALREAVKGWALGTKKLPGMVSPHDESKYSYIHEEDFVFEPITVAESDTSLASVNRGMIKTESALTKNLLVEYFLLSQQDYSSYMKTEACLLTRVQLEKMILTTIQILPHTIISPINIVITLSNKYKTFPDLLYLLSEHFPTYAVQRLMFSAYLLKNSG